MVKIYFRKLLWLGIAVISWLLLYFFEYMLIYLIAKGAVMSSVVPVVRYSVLFGIPLIIVLLILIKCRVRNSDLKQDYLQEFKGKFGWKNEWRYVIKSADFRMELLAFISALLPLFIRLAISSSAPFYADFLAGVIVLVLLSSVYLVLGFLVRVIIHRVWSKQSDEVDVEEYA